MLFTDHIALKYVNTQNKLNIRHAKLDSFLQGYTFVLRHKLGRKNQYANALSWCIVLFTTMENQVSGFVVLNDVYASDNDILEIVEQLKNQVVENMDLIQSEYFVQDGYLFKGKQLCITICYYDQGLNYSLTVPMTPKHMSK